MSIAPPPITIPGSLREAALAYAAAGIKVFRVRQNKAPYANCQQCSPRIHDCPNPAYTPHRPEECRCTGDTCHGFWAATTDAGTIARWWAEEPDANIGAPCKLNGWAVVDIDPRNGGHASLCAVEARVGVLPGSVTQITGGNGLHILYRSPDAALPATPFPGIDFKHNGYILLAPSLHSSGGRYRWSGGEFRRPQVPWPAALLPRKPAPRPAPIPRQRTQHAPSSGRRDFIAELVQQVMDAAPGTRYGRNNSLYAAACKAHALAARGLVDIDDARDALMNAADAVGLDGGQRQAEATFDSASQRTYRGGRAA